MAQGTLASLGYPLDRVSFFKAHDSSEYPNEGDEYAVLEAMRADGFTLDDDFVNVSTVLPNKRCACVWQWTWCSLLRHIADSGVMSIHLCDDILPLIDWRRMNLMAAEAVERSKDFKGIQLSTDILQHSNYRHAEVDHFNSMLGRGLFQANDFGEVLSPKGAQVLLERSLARPYLQPHRVIGEFAVLKKDKDNWFHVLQRTVAHNFQWARDWVGHPENRGIESKDVYPEGWID